MSVAKQSYTSLVDDVLAELSAQGDESAFNELVVRYLGKIGYIARKYSAQGYEQKDFVQEGLMGLLSAVKTFDPHGGSSFKNYVALVVERRFISIIRRQNKHSAVPEQALVQFDALDSEPVDSAATPEQQLMRSEQLRLLRERLPALLSRRELEVLLLYADELSYRDIARRLGISEKSVDNALQRARRKLETFG